MKILFLEPFYGGSHKAFADGLVNHSAHDIDLVTLPARFWKWRMRGAALHFARKIKNPGHYDLLFTCDLVSLSDLKALWGPACPPAIVYFHENQLSYPLPEGEKMDYQFAFTDITTGLAADRVVFNGQAHRDAFFAALPRFIRRMPEFRPTWAAREIENKSQVLHPGVELPRFPAPSADEPLDGAPIVVWNHRWEFDKCPDVFFRSMDALDDRGIDFRLALLGENFQAVPKEFIAARERYGDRILHYGYAADRDDYWRWLRRGTLTVSTAIQENFGISLVEAAYAGCHPLVPRRLSYPEVIPASLHTSCLYDNEADLVERAARILSGAPRSSREDLTKAFAPYAWEKAIGAYDTLFGEVGRG